MSAVILVIHILVAIALVATVLLQRSEGGALGIGGGGGAGGFMTGRGAANLLTRTTTILAATFFATSITLTILARTAAAPTSVIDSATTKPAGDAKKGPALPVLPQLPGSQKPAGPQVPVSR